MTPPCGLQVWVEEACHLLVVSKAEYLQRLGPIHALDAQIRLREYRAVPAFDTCAPRPAVRGRGRGRG
mgnify:CR=1 FL=1|jgi:hypothetical protein